MYDDLLQNINYIEGLYLYGSGEMDQLSPLKENSKEGKEIFESSIPRKIPLHFISKKETIKLIKCGAMSTFILSTEGNVYSFGCSDNGALGHEESISAKIVPLKFKAIGISGGDCHGVAYNRENLAFWGQFRNKNGKIGKACIEPKYFNNKNINNEFYKKVISGTNHVLILTEKKNIFGFGNNEFGQIGVSPEKIISHFQMNKFYEKNVEDIYTGDEHSFLIKNENGRKILKSWGLNNNGQLGIGSFATNNEQNTNIYVPTKVIFPGLFNISIKKVTGGSSTSICLTEDNRVFVWGLNDFYLLGLKDKNKIIASPKEIEFFNKYLNPNNEIDDIYANFQYFYAKNKKTNKVYSWGSGDSFILGNKKEKAETTPYLINHLFFKNLYVSDLSLGCSHVAVLLTEKKDINLCQEENHKNELSNSKSNKTRKRKNIENSSDKKEKIEDYGVLVKVKEEYITLDKHDQPKLSVKKIKTEKKIIQNKEINKKNIDKKEENEESKDKDMNNILDKAKKEIIKSSSKKNTSKKNEDNCEKRENTIEKEKNEDSNKKELKKNSIKKEKVDERNKKKEIEKKSKSNQKLIKSNSKYSMEKEEEDRMKRDISKNRRKNDDKKEEESEKRNQIKKNKKSKENDKNEDEKDLEDNEESIKKNKNKSSKSKKNKDDKNENESASMRARRKNEEENKNKKGKSKSINNIIIKSKSKSKEKKYPRK